MAKYHKTSFPKKSNPRSTLPLQLVHSDTCGPVSASSFGGGRCFLNFIDDYSRFCWTYIHKHKGEAFDKFLEFKAQAERQSGQKILTLRTDNRGEFESHKFQDYCRGQGILRHLTTPYSSSQNGIAERKNRTLQDAARAMLKQAGLPNTLLGRGDTNSYLPAKHITRKGYAQYYSL